MLFEVKGLVIRTVNLSESDRLITLFTDQYGLIVAYANNSRSLKSRYMSAAQLFCYGSYVLYKKGDRFWVREVELIENFFGLRASIEKTALASYLAEVLCDEGVTPAKFKRLAFPDVNVAKIGGQKWIRDQYGLQARGIADSVRQLLK